MKSDLVEWCIKILRLEYSLRYGRFKTQAGRHLPPEGSIWFWDVIAEEIRKWMLKNHDYLERKQLSNLSHTWLLRGPKAFINGVREVTENDRL